MAKVNKSQSDKFLKVVKKQDEPKLKPVNPPTLGEASMVTNWEEHIVLGHNIKHYVQIRPGKIDGQKQAFVTTPVQGTIFVPVMEYINDSIFVERKRYYHVWIMCIQNNTNRVLYKIDSGEVDFVLWDVLEKDKADEHSDVNEHSDVDEI
jgi:hypothetical protein